MFNTINLLPEGKNISYFLDKPIIAIPDGWHNPVIGFVNDLRDQKLVVHDYIEDKEVEIAYRTFIFTEQRYQLVLKLDPFELGSILYPEECLEEDFRKDKKVFLLKPEEMNARLRYNCFWKDLLEYREELREELIAVAK